MDKRYFGMALVWGVIFTAGRRADGDSVTLPPSADTSLFENEPDNTLGASVSLVSGSNASGYRSRELMRFDFAGQVPANAVIQSVTLTVNLVTAPGGGGTASTFDLHRLLADWGEGVGTGNMGSPANPGEATWNNRFHPSTPWTAPGASISNDFAAVVSASLPWNGLGVYTYTSTSNLVADVQQWVSNPSANFGWIFLSGSENIPQTARRIASREDANNAPSLQVQFVLPAAPAIQGLAANGGVIQFSFAALAGQTYFVQYRGSLNTGSWQTLTNFNSSNATNVIISDAIQTNAQRFYRVALAPGG